MSLVMNREDTIGISKRISQISLYDLLYQSIGLKTFEKVTQLKIDRDCVRVSFLESRE
jgi:hypothetical protein